MHVNVGSSRVQKKALTISPGYSVIGSCELPDVSAGK